MMAYLLATATASAANIMLFREDLHIHAVLAASATLTFTVYCFYAARPTSSTCARIRSTSMTKAKGVSLVSIILYALGMAFLGDSSGLSIDLAFKIASALTLTPLLFTDALLVIHDRHNHRVR